MTHPQRQGAHKMTRCKPMFLPLPPPIRRCSHPIHEEDSQGDPAAAWPGALTEGLCAVPCGSSRDRLWSVTGHEDWVVRAQKEKHKAGRAGGEGGSRGRSRV